LFPAIGVTVLELVAEPLDYVLFVSSMLLL
jgi:hypothetical protein